MATSVNPPINVLRSTQFDSPAYKRALEDILFQMWTRTGGGSDTINNISIQEQFAWDVSSSDERTDKESLNTFFNMLVESPEYNAVSTSTNYTANAFDFVNAKSGSAIKLLEYPNENDVVIIRNGDGTNISFSGNGKNINGESAGKITRQGTTLVIQYFIDENEWFVR